MTNVEARIRIKEKHYEINVDLNEALKVKSGEGNITLALQSPQIYYDLKKGTVASQSDLQSAFGTIDIYEIAKQIIQKGEVQKTQEYRDEEREKKIKQVISLLLQNATDQNSRPCTEERIKAAINEVHFNFDSRPAEKQMADLVKKLKEVIPIKIETKRIKLIVPAQYTGQLYGALQEYKESEEWLSNGNLQVILNIPAGLVMDFYDKINSIAHGAIQSEELHGE
ncbi:MAG: ribosome assembly factor SBDS [Nanoarchaeota archaeon]|nr:ribosome assembly factor SBDS [Nanoarchaeota archaeon]MBU1051653.1 ribosome assembly factor SBDS [Nanoarchaeota archaeon]MBU1988787.1 ribosome assembly factor SBDS [Nanoarchaeota archaeon]